MKEIEGGSDPLTRSSVTTILAVIHRLTEMRETLGTE